MTSERTDQSATPGNHPSHPGATLAAQREAMGWSVEQVAEQLKLTVRQVVAIEAADYASLPGPAVTRGFVRAYAKILRLDPAPLVAMVPMDNPVAADEGGAVRRDRAPSRSFSHSRYPMHGKRSSLPLGWIAAAVVVVAAGAAAWHFGLVALPGSTESAPAGEAVLETPAANGGATAPVPDTGLNPSVPLISVPAPADPNAPAAGAANGTPAAAPGAAAPGAAAPAAGATGAPAAATGTPAAVPNGALPATVPGAAPAAAAPVPAGANTLVLTVKQDSWIEVRPQGGKALISRLVRAGSTESVEIPGSATLVVGNPTGVSATLRGAALALPPVPGKTISRVTIK